MTGNHENEGYERLRDEEVDRIYNVYLPQEHFALFEDHLRSEVETTESRDHREKADRLERFGTIRVPFSPR